VIDGGSIALLLVGAQPAWVGRSTGTEAVTAVIERLATAIREIGGAVVATRHAAATAGQRRTGLPPARHEPGWEICPLANVADVVVDAAGIDAFTGSPLDGELRARGADHLVLVGFGAEAAVDSTLRSANDRGYECLVVTDAVAPFDPATGAAALASVTMSGGIFGALAASDELLAALGKARPVSRPSTLLSPNQTMEMP
jgi:nicotinamidase-related amidase